MIADMDTCDVCNERRLCLVFIAEEFNRVICLECIIRLFYEWLKGEQA